MNDNDFENEAKQVFDEHVAGLDAQTRSRLTQARYAAIEASRPRRAYAPWIGGAVAAGTVAALVVINPLNDEVTGPALDTPVAQQATDLEMLLGDDELEMLEELEFYAWLDEADVELDGIG